MKCVCACMYGQNHLPFAASNLASSMILVGWFMCCFAASSAVGHARMYTAGPSSISIYIIQYLSV